jgi:putative acetyltransferase
MTALVRHATTPADVLLARGLFVEYATWLDVDLCFQGFPEELASLPGGYAPPAGRLLLAGEPGAAFGCIALRPLVLPDDVHRGAVPATGEVKRLYVRPAHRAGGWGHRLAAALLDEARTIGYQELKLDTLDWMTAARGLYARLGFRECPAYYPNPLPGVVYMSCRL